MRLLVIITARGGSKRLPNKNTRLLGAKPLVVWSIEVAKKISGITEIIVSTDDVKTAEICAANGAFVPWLRPEELSTDYANSVDVVIHALDWYEKEKGVVDGVILLQPTSPFRTIELVNHGIFLFKKFSKRTIIGVSKAKEHPMWMMRINENNLTPMMEPHGFGIRSQDLPPAYVVNGGFYMVSPECLRSAKSFVTENAIPLIFQSEEESLDIDTQHDWDVAEMIISKRLNKKL